jgi:hypothetical protein
MIQVLRALGEPAVARRAQRLRRRCCGVLVALMLAPSTHADESPEYKLKAAFVYNFAAFTEWPADTGSAINLCIVGNDPFGKELDPLRGRALGSRTLSVHNRPATDALQGCQVVFIAPSAIGQLPRLLDGVRGRPVLTVADSAGAARQGVALNMAVLNGRIAFEANLNAARGAGLDLSSKLLRLATEVIQ